MTARTAKRPRRKTTPVSRAWRRHGLTLVAAPLGVLLSYFAAHYLLFSYYKVRYPYPLEVGEGEVLNYAMILASPDPLYAPLRPETATIVNYPPVVPALVRAVTDPAAPSFGPGRMLVVAATLLTTALAVLVARKRGAPQLLALLAGLLFLANPAVLPCANYLRVDPVALAFSFAGLCAFLVVPGRRGALLSAPLFLLGAFSKHSAIFAPLAVATYLAVNDRRRLAPFLAVFVGGGAAIVAVAQRWTGGEFLRHLLVYTYDGWSATRFVSYLYEYAAKPAGTGGVLGLAALGTWLAWAVRGGPRDAAWFYFPWAALSLALVGKHGSSVYYFAEFALASAVTIALGLAALMAPTDETAPSPTPAALALVPPLIAFLIGFSFFTSGLISADRFRRDVAVDRVIRASHGPYFAEDVGLIVLAGKRPPYPNTYSLAAAIERRSWDPSVLLDGLRDGRFPFVYTESDLMNPGADTRERLHPVIRRAIEENFGPGPESSPAFIYVSKVLWNTPRANAGAPPR